MKKMIFIGLVLIVFSSVIMAVQVTWTAEVSEHLMVKKTISKNGAVSILKSNLVKTAKAVALTAADALEKAMEKLRDKIDEAIEKLSRGEFVINMCVTMMSGGSKVWNNCLMNSPAPNAINY